MVGGNVLQHVKNNKPHVDIIALVGVFSVLSTTVSNYAHKLLDIIRGVCYLHSEGFVHGDLRAVRVYMSMVIVHADLFRPTFLWMAEALLALRTLVSYLLLNHLTNQPMAVEITNGWLRSSLQICRFSALQLPTSTLSVAYASRYDQHGIQFKFAHHSLMLAAYHGTTFSQCSPQKGNVHGGEWRAPGAT
jgi:hypothetical protein